MSDYKRKYFKLSDNCFAAIILICVISCKTSSSKEFRTNKTLHAAESSLIKLLEDPDVKDGLKNLMPSQSFIYLGQFYGFAYNFGMPGCDADELEDGWRRPLRIAFDDKKSTVWSIGPDGIDQFGNGDDIKVEIWFK